MVQATSDVGISASSGNFGFYRLPDGSVQPADADPTEMVKRMREGWQPLEEYGLFIWGVYYAEHPLEVLFQRGGASELSPAYVREMGFDHSPPLIPVCDLTAADRHGQRRTAGHIEACWRGAQSVSFPQLEGETSDGPHGCRYCDRKDLPTTEALSQHESVMHKDQTQTAELGHAIAQGVRGDHDFMCRPCGIGFDDPKQFNAHLIDLHTERSTNDAIQERQPGERPEGAGGKSREREAGPKRRRRRTAATG